MGIYTILKRQNHEIFLLFGVPPEHPFFSASLLFYISPFLQPSSPVSSVSDPYSLNPDPAKNLNPDPGKFFSPIKKICLKLKRKKM